MTAFLHWGNQSKIKMSKKQTHSQRLRKQHAFELLSIFQNKSRVLFWILKEHRAISVSFAAASHCPAAARSKLLHFSITLETTLS